MQCTRRASIWSLIRRKWRNCLDIQPTFSVVNTIQAFIIFENTMNRNSITTNESIKGLQWNVCISICYSELVFFYVKSGSPQLKVLQDVWKILKNFYSNVQFHVYQSNFVLCHSFVCPVSSDVQFRCYSYLINKHQNHNTLCNLIQTYKWKNFIIRITLTAYHIIHHCHENRPLIKDICFMLFGNKILKKSPKVITRLIVLGIRDLHVYIPTPNRIRITVSFFLHFTIQIFDKYKIFFLLFMKNHAES